MKNKLWEPSSNLDLYPSQLRSVHIYWKFTSSGSEWHCTLYTVHCTLYNVHCTLYTAHCTLHTVHCTLYAPCASWLMTVNSALEFAFVKCPNEQITKWLLYLACVIIKDSLAVKSEVKSIDRLECNQENGGAPSPRLFPLLAMSEYWPNETSSSQNELSS
jgi:hypothetical protein